MTRRARRYVVCALVVGSTTSGALAFGCGSEAGVSGSPQRQEAGPAVADATADDARAQVDAVAPPADAAMEATDAGRPPPLHVLFIGDSYTYVNDVPGILARIASTAGMGPNIVTDEVVQGGATLQDLLDAGVAAARIAERKWTHVILQDQSVEPALWPSGFLAAADQFGAQIVDAGARTTWFVTWARAASDQGFYPLYFYDPAEMQDRLTAAYDHAMRDNPGSLLGCVGEAFRATLHDHPEIVLQQADGSHATLAGSYLAASTLYVALTGSPVPSAAEVPAGISAQQAAALRQEANVGSSCADVRIRASVSIGDVLGNDLVDLTGEDGGLLDPFDYGLAGVPVPALFVVENSGDLPATIVGQTLSGPFEWTGGAFPGGASAPDGGVPFCSDSATLAPNSACYVSVSFTSAASGSGHVTIELANAYQPSVARTLAGTSGSKDRALLTVSEDIGLCARTTPASCDPFWNWGPASLYFERVPPGEPYNLVVANRGGAPTTAIGPGGPLPSPLIWGVPAAVGFPGGSGAGVAFDPLGNEPTVTLPYCGQVLAPGERCLVGIGLSGTTTAVSGAVSIAYADAKGPAAADAVRDILAIPALSDAGVDQ